MIVHLVTISNLSCFRTIPPCFLEACDTDVPSSHHIRYLPISQLFPVIVPTLIVRNLRLASFFNHSRLFCGSPSPLLVLLRRWHNASLMGYALAISTFRKLCGICFCCLHVLRPAGTRHQPSSFIRLGTG